MEKEEVATVALSTEVYHALLSRRTSKVRCQYICLTAPAFHTVTRKKIKCVHPKETFRSF